MPESTRAEPGTTLVGTSRRECLSGGLFAGPHAIPAVGGATALRPGSFPETASFSGFNLTKHAHKLNLLPTRRAAGEESTIKKRALPALKHRFHSSVQHHFLMALLCGALRNIRAGMISNSLAAQKKKRLIIWIIRQLITACIVIPVVIAWPKWNWLIPAWIGLALFSLVAMLLMFRRLEQRIGHVVSELSSAPRSDRNA